MSRLNITFCSFPDFSGNAKALYEYMQKQYKKNMNYTWIVYNESSVKILKEKKINVILIGTDEFKKYIKTTDVFFTTHVNLSGDKEKTSDALYVELWHGIGPKPVGFLANKLSKSDRKWYNSLREVIDYIIVPTDFWKVIFSSIFNVEGDRIKSLGLPLLDEIKNSEGKKNINNILNIDIDKYKKVILYAPTFKSGCGRTLESKINPNNIMDLKEYSDEKLNKYLENNNYLLIVKRHPSEECEYKILETDNIKNISSEMLEKNGMDINNILNAFDLLITDYSSLGIEFNFLNRPVIYLSTYINEYKDNRGIIFDDYDFWTDSIYCDCYDDLINNIDRYINKKYISKNRNLYYGKLTDGGCKNICDYFFEDYKLKESVNKYKSVLLDTLNQNRVLEDTINEQENTIKKLTESDIELRQIKNSKGYKIVENVRKIKYIYRKKDK